MIEFVKKYFCTKCGSDAIRKNGSTIAGKQKYHYKACNAYGSVDPQRGYGEDQHELVISAYIERSSLRGLERVFRISPQTIGTWVKKVAKLPNLRETPVPAEANDILELDELWSFI